MAFLEGAGTDTEDPPTMSDVSGPRERVPPRRPTRRRTPFALVVAATLLVVSGAAMWWFLLREAAPGPVQGASCGAGPVAGGEADGTWVVVDDPDTFVGYRIEERFGGDAVDKTAAGRSPAVSGSMTIDGTRVTAVDVTADLTRLRSDSPRRDAYLAGRGLETTTYPEAHFVLTEPIDLGGRPAQGVQVQGIATGELTLRGRARSVSVPVTACWSGERIDVSGATTIVLADHGIDPPDLAGLVRVADRGELELRLVLRPRG